MTVNIDSIRSDLLKEFDKFERGESFSFDAILDKMNKLRYVMQKINDIKNNKRYKPYNSWSGTKDHDLRYALEYAKELENLVK